MVPMLLPGSGGSIRATNLPLRLLVRAAYKLEDDQIIGGPPWQLSSKFDITAKPEDGAVVSEDALRERLKALLADRFKLKTHTESREMTVSALMLARPDGKLGPNLKPSTADCSNAAGRGAEAGRRNPPQPGQRGVRDVAGQMRHRPDADARRKRRSAAADGSRHGTADFQPGLAGHTVHRAAGGRQDGTDW